MVDSADKVKAFENFTLDAAADAPAAEQKPAAGAEEKPAAAKKPKKKKAAAAGGGASTLGSLFPLFILSLGFPKHQKVAMPALSPTMKNVTFLYSNMAVLNFSHRARSQPGPRKKETSWVPETFSVRSRPTRPPWVSRSRRKPIWPRS